MKIFNHNNQQYFVTRNGVVFKEDIILSQYDNGHGYKMVVLSGIPYYIHKLMASLYVPNPNNKTFVNHKNKIIQDNRVINLEWIELNEDPTSEYKKADQAKRINKLYRKPIAQLDKDTGSVIKIHGSQVLAAREMRVHQKSIWSALNRPHLCKGFKWAYA
jgi:hypothetical protein